MDDRGEIRTEDPPFGQVAEALGLGMPFQIRASADGVQRRFVYLGASCERLTGVPAAAALSDPRRLYDQILPEHQAEFLAAEEAALIQLAPFSMDVAMRRADGQVRWARIASAPRRLADGSTLWDGLLTDITDSRELAVALDRQLCRLEVAVEATGLGLWEWDTRTGQVNWSERNRALFGVAPDEPVTIESYLAQVHPDDLPRLRETYRRARDDASQADFSLEHRIVTPAGEVRWLLAHGRVTRDEQGPALVVGTSLDVTERRTAEDRRELMMGELAHRAKNGMLIMLAMVRQAAHSATTAAEMEQVLAARIQAMAASQDLLTAAGGRAVFLGDLFDQLLPMFDAGRFDIDPQTRSVAMPGETAIGMALLLHELGTNAVKHGALSRRDGRIRIASRWTDSAGARAIEWRESGGPEVRPSGRRGFGSRLLEAALRDRGGKVEPSFNPEGFSAVVEFRAAD